MALVFGYVMVATWTCLSDTPVSQKNTLFARFITSLEVLSAIANDASLVFAPGLLDVVQCVAPPTIDWFKSLPNDTSGSRWGVYALVFEKPGSRWKLYIGSGTNKTLGVQGRWNNYDDKSILPSRVKDALDNDYTITYKGLLCWAPLPHAVILPITRILFFALEAAFAYMFWAMEAPTGRYGMGDMFLWPGSATEYDGLCSHCALTDGFQGDFDMTPEQLEAQAADAEEKRLALKALNATNYHYKQMAENYDHYIGESIGHVQESRKNNPGRDAKYQARRVETALEENTYRYEPCDLSLGTKQRLKDHETTFAHQQKVNPNAKPVQGARARTYASHIEAMREAKKFYCIPCDKPCGTKQHLTSHEQTQGHKRMVARQTKLPTTINPFATAAKAGPSIELD
ncbi:carbamoyl-phosphate synthase (glutamine-hydrolyzing) cpa2 [Recurvomyces mirabilis]|nr:carbamoyl-phosphate synthase (glutamine-hydrolyzing) cpa2 [Recurvomyces mirabilis]